MNQRTIHYLRDKKGFDVSTDGLRLELVKEIGECHVFFYTSKNIKTTRRTFARNVENLFIAKVVGRSFDTFSFYYPLPTLPLVSSSLAQTFSNVIQGFLGSKP